MILEILLFLLTTLVGYFIYSYTQMNQFFKRRGVKHFPGVPFFGNMYDTTFLKKHFLDEIQVIHDAFPDEKYVGFMEFTMPVLLIRDPELIKSITVKDFDHFTDHREFFSEEADPLFAGSLLLMKGERWREMRTTLSPAFTASKMKLMLPLIVENSDNIIQYLHDHQSEIIEVDDLMRRYTNDVIASAGFGLKINSLEDRDNEFFKIGNNVLNFNLKQRVLFIVSTLFPNLTKKLGVRLFPEKTYNFFKNIVTSTMEYRTRENVERPDMIQLLMEAKGDWSPDEITGQVFIFFAAGFDTTASVLVMAIHELAINPEVQERLYQECRQLKEDKGLTFDSLSELKYLDSVLNETLRKWSPAIFMDRTCVKTYELPPPREGGQSYTLKPGDVIYNMVNTIHMDPNHYPDPHKFDPERFSEENKHKIKPCTFSPFGGGPRLCIGMRFAMMELKVLIFQIMLNFTIVKTEKTMDPIKLKPHSFNIKALNGTWVKFQKRE
uniref:unspecific monooxygenase n=1 Tax=Mythimna separata TaxID=271217 RepID=A0A7G3WA77_MYTSE|nr:cytochrome P450 CYP9A104 [Mythimna separata]